ncbi:MAG TPA: hypothetical protein VLA16_16890 [Ideonella sp.]|nr:hypothetical protein [Ideonella sp.]
MQAALLAEPRWREAARALVNGCADLQQHPGEAVQLLERVCSGLGDELYPALLRVLCEVGRHADHGARAAVALALVQALRTGRLPSGRRAAWGASQRSAGLRTGRSLGPLEYLCACAGDPDARSTMPGMHFDSTAQALMAVISASDEARLLYCEQLLAQARDPMEGVLSRGARQAMRALADTWASQADPVLASAHFLAALKPAGASAAWPPAPRC